MDFELNQRFNQLKLRRFPSSAELIRSESNVILKESVSLGRIPYSVEMTYVSEDIASEFLPEASNMSINIDKGEDRLQASYEDQNRLVHYRYRKRRLVPVAPPIRMNTRTVQDLYNIESSLRPLRMSFSFSYPSLDTQAELMTIANKLVSPGRGILSADENASTIGKRFFNIGIENCEETRRRYREMLFTVDRSISDYISGVVLLHDSLFQKTNTGASFVELLKERNLLVGVKVDRGTVPLFCSDGEVTTQGLDDLDARCAQYKRDGCDFAKWRCVLKIGKHTPSTQAINENANMLARFASICQAHAVVPLLQPEVIADGDHDILTAQKVTEKAMAALYKALNDHHVFLEGSILKPNMVIPGLQCVKRCTPMEIASATVLTFQRTVPPAVAGIAFISGGQSEEEAAINLDAINKTMARKPWPLSFSFSQGLQLSVIRIWGGREENKEEAQEELLKRAKILSLATKGWFYKIDTLMIHGSTIDGPQGGSLFSPP